MSLFDVFKPKAPPTPEAPAILTVLVDGQEITRVHADELPCEKTPSAAITPDSTVSFVDADGRARVHGFGDRTGWAHLSVRVRETKACQVDGIVTDSEQFDPNAYGEGRATGIRFQPFFLPGSPIPDDMFAGKGLFQRGLHFSGTITSGNTVLSCECDRCHKTFLIRSYHAGFSELGYFYSGSGSYTLGVPNRVAGSPVALQEPDPAELADLESRLPSAPDGSRFLYLNPFRCPHCSAPYIDFEAHPDLRPQEYYGNYFEGSEMMYYRPPEGDA